MTDGSKMFYGADGNTMPGVVTVDPTGTPYGASNPQAYSPAKATTGGLSQFPFRTLTAAGANASVVKAGAGQIYGYHFANTSAAWRFVHLYNSAAAPTMGTTADVRVIPIPPGGVVSYNATNIGIAFPVGISIAATTANGATDNTVANIAVGDVVGMLDYA